MSNANLRDRFDFKSVAKHDFLASIVVFLVALPLCMGIALASGVPVAAGLITGIVGGIVVGLLAGAPLQVSGPAAGLTVIVYEVVTQQGLEFLGMVVLIAGGLQLAAGLLRLGQWFRAVSPAVIHGMLAGIGVLILSSQFHVMVDEAPKGSGLENLASIPEAIRKGLPWPALASEESRVVRRDLLQEVGLLHERQVQIGESAAEKLPANFDEDEIDSTALAQVSDEQRTLQADLSRTLEDVTEGKSLFNNARRYQQVRDAVESAVAKNAAAAEALTSGSWEEVRPTQREAARSLEAAAHRLKNHDWAAKVGLLTILLLVGWESLASKRLKLVPAPLVAICAVTALVAWLKLPVLYVAVPDSLWSEIHLPSLVVLRGAPLGALLQAGLVVAIVASAETLLCATAVDKLKPGPKTDYDRELAAQGIGNLVCGFLGALPMTGVIVRSAANVEAGGRTRLSAILHGAWLLVFVAALGFLLRAIPTASLAAMLVYIGYKLVKPQTIRELAKYGRGEVLIYLATVVMIVATDLLTGVLTGVVLSALKLLYTFSHLKTSTHTTLDGRTVLNLEGAATFLRLPQLADILENVPEDAELHVDMEHLHYIDHACLDLMMDWAKQHESVGGMLVIDWNSLHARFHDTPKGPLVRKSLSA